MDLLIYDRDINLIGVIDKLNSLIWTRRFWSCGDFKLLAPFTPRNSELLREYRLIGKRGDDQLAEIEYVKLRKNSQGVENIEVQGKFITARVSQRVIRNQITMEDTAGNIFSRIFNENIISPTKSERGIPNVSLDLDVNLPIDVISYASEPIANVLTACESLAKALKIGFYMSTDVRDKTHVFKVYTGRDLTAQNPTGNAPCVFAQEFDNIIEQEYTYSVENVKTTAYVGGEEIEGTPRVFVEVGGGASELDRREVYIDAKDLKRKYKNTSGVEVTMTPQQYADMLYQRGVSMLEKYVENQSFYSKINPFGALRYRRDFDLGDLVTCISRRWGVRVDARITEAAEIYETKGDRLEITFGESIPTLSEKIRQII